MPKCLAWLSLLLAAGVILLPLAVVSLFQRQQPLRISTDRAIRLYLPTTGSLQVFPLEEYLVGVVAAEMPARFASEALKAQAIAARTYALQRMLLARQGKGAHSEADVCNDPQHCQAWLSELEMRQRWGLMGYWLYHRKVVAAVAATRGLVLTYKGELIDPVYHAASGGRTAAAEEVWGRAVPYLVSVPSPWEADSSYYISDLTLPAADVARRLGLVLNQGQTLSLRVVDYTASGRVKTVAAGDRCFSGTEFRRLLGLNSCLVRWEQEKDRFTFHTRGYGHGVGMSQYGADGLARRGKTTSQILSHYYPGSRIQSLETISLP